MQDKTHHVIFNCAAAEQEKDAKIRDFLAFVKNNEKKGPLSKEIDKLVEVKKFEQSFLNEFMARRLAEHDLISLGKDMGREEGIDETKISTAKKMLELSLPLDTIIEVTGLTKERLQELVQ